MNLIGQTIGDHKIELEIGRGGTSVVYRATDLRTHKDVALKVMLPELIDNEMALRRFLREGNAAARLQHPNIVQIYEAGQADGHYYIAMELIHGGTLADHIKRKGELLETEQILAILSQIGAALDHAHSQGIVHRDLKLSNILLTADDRALLSDFGIAKHLFSEQTMVTAVGRAVGTPSFMSPEQITGEIEIDYRSDIYSLGVIAYVLFTGRTPFAADTTPQLMYKIAYDAPISPEIINPGLSPDIAFVLLKALSKEPSERYASAHKFVISLSTCQSCDCEIISGQVPIKQRKLVKSMSTKWPLKTKVPVEAFMGAMISMLVLIIVLSPSFSVTPQFVFAKLKEVDLLQSIKLAVESNRQHVPTMPDTSSNLQAISFSATIQEFSLLQMVQSLPSTMSEVFNWNRFDNWMQRGYNMIVTLLALEDNAPSSVNRVGATSRTEATLGPKPTLPTIMPKLLP